MILEFALMLFYLNFPQQVRDGKEKIRDGDVIPTESEEKVFEILNLTYRCPEERDH